jgi:hypothetical protein
MRNLHTDQWYATTGSEIQYKCPRCGAHGKAIELFYRHSASPTGFSCYCKKCQLERNRDNKFLRRYGVDAEGREKYWEAADGKCEICGTALSTKDFHLDHCHKNGNIRGVLCKSCNHGLGMFKDNLETLAKAISYLEERSIV